MPNTKLPLAQTWPADPTTAAAIRRSVLQFAHDAGMRAPDLHAVALAVTEAASNASIHAFADGDEGGHISVQAAVSDGHLRVVISDDGRGMHPRTDSPGMGAGLLIIVQLAERLRIEDGQDGGTRVSMDFALH